MIIGNWKKLSPRDAGEIRARAQPGEAKAALAREYGVRAETVRYHTLHAKYLDDGYGRCLELAAEARRKGNFTEAARLLNLAAEKVKEVA